MCVSMIRVDSQMMTTGYKRKTLNEEMGIPNFYEKLIVDHGKDLSGSTISRLARILDTTPEYLCCDDVNDASAFFKVSGDVLKARRIEMKYGQKVLTNMIGKRHPSWLCTLESKVSTASADAVDALCYYLKCDRKYIAGESSTIDKNMIPKLPESIIKAQDQFMETVVSSKLKRYIESNHTRPGNLAKDLQIPLEYLKRGMCVDTKFPIDIIKKMGDIFNVDPTALSPLFYLKDLDPEKMDKKETTTVKKLSEKEKENIIHKSVSVPAKTEKAEPVQGIVEDRMISVNGLAKVTEIAVKRPELLNLMIQINELDDQKIEKAIEMIDVITKGLIVL